MVEEDTAMSDTAKLVLQIRRAALARLQRTALRCASLHVTPLQRWLEHRIDALRERISQLEHGFEPMF